jgi:hypothetical protein
MHASASEYDSPHSTKSISSNCVCVCMHACMFACMHTCMLLRLSMILPIRQGQFPVTLCVYVWIYASVCMCKYVCMCACMYICMYTSVCMCVCMYINIYIYIYIYIYACMTYVFVHVFMYTYVRMHTLSVTFVYNPRINSLKSSARKFENDKCIVWSLGLILSASARPDDIRNCALGCVMRHIRSSSRSMLRDSIIANALAPLRLCTQ